MLISRTQSRLDDASKEIGTKHNVKTKTIAVDFGKADAGTWSTLKAEVGPPQVSRGTEVSGKHMSDMCTSGTHAANTLHHHIFHCTMV